MEGDFAWGGEHTIQYTDDKLYSCIPETYRSFLGMFLNALKYMYVRLQRQLILLNYNYQNTK